jgi:hypothetical protein
MDSENYIKMEKLYMKDSLKIISLTDGGSRHNILDNLDKDYMMVMEFISNFKILTEKLLLFIIKVIFKVVSILDRES